MNHSLHFATVCACIVLGAAGQSQARFDFKNQKSDFSYDRFSPEAGFIPASTILYAAYPTVKVAPANLALLAAEDVKSFSYGYDHWLEPRASDKMRTQFSVTRTSTGAAGSVIATQAGGNGAAGDLFQLTTIGPAAIPAGVTLVLDSTVMGLTPGVGVVQSSIDGLDNHQNFIMGGNFRYRRVYFTVDAPAAARLTLAMGTAVTQATVLIQTSPTNPLPSVYATPAQLGLVPGDVIDALAVRDMNNNLGVLNSDDFVYISLAPGSPSAAALGTASVIEVYPAAAATVKLTPADLSLAATDDIDAITLYDPCPADISPASGGNTVVGIDDLLSVINQWGQCPVAPVCNGDINGDEWVNVDDLLDVFAQWGPCP